MTISQYKFENEEKFYRGKVRDVHYIGKDFIVIIASDRISAFDFILPKPIKYKGQVLNKIATQFLRETEDIIPNWLLETPHPNVSIGHQCEAIKVEMVVRGYLAGHAWRTYKSGERELCGVSLPNGMNQNDKFPNPIITPATKADSGHDEDISREEIIKKGIISEKDYDYIAQKSLELFKRGTEIAKKKGLILVDTKYEFGFKNGEIMLIDEIHTPDSSRYFYSDDYEENQKKKIPQKQLSKEFVREWLMENNFQGLENQQIPEMTDDVVTMISDRYIELYEKLMGKSFVRDNQTIEIDKINSVLNLYTKK